MYSTALDLGDDDSLYSIYSETYSSMRPSAYFRKYDKNGVRIWDYEFSTQVTSDYPIGISVFKDLVYKIWGKNTGYLTYIKTHNNGYLYTSSGTFDDNGNPVNSKLTGVFKVDDKGYGHYNNYILSPSGTQVFKFNNSASDSDIIGKYDIRSAGIYLEKTCINFEKDWDYGNDTIN